MIRPILQAFSGFGSVLGFRLIGLPVHFRCIGAPTLLSFGRSGPPGIAAYRPSLRCRQRHSERVHGPPLGAGSDVSDSALRPGQADRRPNARQGRRRCAREIVVLDVSPRDKNNKQIAPILNGKRSKRCAKSTKSTRASAKTFRPSTRPYETSRRAIPPCRGFRRHSRWRSSVERR